MLVPVWVLVVVFLSGGALGLLVGVLLHPLIAKVPPYQGGSVGDQRLRADREGHDAAGPAGH